MDDQATSCKLKKIQKLLDTNTVQFGGLFSTEESGECVFVLRTYWKKSSVGIHRYLAVSRANLRVLEALAVFPDCEIGFIMSLGKC